MADAETQKTEITTVELSDDIVFGQILLRLPAKSVVKFKRVCRHWDSKISSRQFAKTYLRHPFSLSSSSVLTLDYSSEFWAFDYTHSTNTTPDYDISNLVLTQFDNPDSVHPFIRLSSSCNGLVFLISSPLQSDDPQFGEMDLPDYLRHFNFEYVVYNPALGSHSFVSIPHPLDQLPLVNDSFNFGFGYVSSGDDYDYYIVAINLIFTKRVVYVYSFKLRQWETPLYLNGSLMEFQDSWYNCVGTLVNQTLHWGVTRTLTLGGEGHQHRKQMRIATFDLAARDAIKLMELPYPNFGNRGRHYDSDFSLSCIDGCLCAWAKFLDDGDVFELWMLKDYGIAESWTKLFRFNPSFYCRDFFGLTQFKMGLIFTAGPKEELMLADFSWVPPECKHTGLDRNVQAVDYVPSLESPFPA